MSAISVQFQKGKQKRGVPRGCPTLTAGPWADRVPPGSVSSSGNTSPAGQFRAENEESCVSGPGQHLACRK